jgi:hypothetical protein
MILAIKLLIEYNGAKQLLLLLLNQRVANQKSKLGLKFSAALLHEFHFVKAQLLMDAHAP